PPRFTLFPYTPLFRSIKVNGSPMEAEVEPRLLLVHCIRDVFRLTGTHIGCDTSHCGACTVLLDGKAIKSCTFFAVQANGRDVTTDRKSTRLNSSHQII